MSKEESCGLIVLIFCVVLCGVIVVESGKYNSFKMEVCQQLHKHNVQSYLQCIHKSPQDIVPLIKEIQWQVSSMIKVNLNVV